MRTRSQSSEHSQLKVLTKKQKAKANGKRLAEINSEKRKRGEIKQSDKPRQSKSQKAGIQFPVHAVLKKLKKFNPKCLVLAKSAVMASAVLEYLVAEILDISANQAIETQRKRIQPRDILLAVKNDQEFDFLLKNTFLASSGVVPGIHPALVNKKNSSKTNDLIKKEQDQNLLKIDHPSITSTPKKRNSQGETDAEDISTQTKRPSSAKKFRK
ncbi:unnamed protein product [Brachionus calyciflorus]|uniref:Histone H2A n=1 Tax=Brachionus calyciflorus TaxID=104777 RepID=A0A813MDS0_9BILA|nr:unnamed protein product [Brachionus calyciflorus]